MPDFIICNFSTETNEAHGIILRVPHVLRILIAHFYDRQREIKQKGGEGDERPHMHGFATFSVHAARVSFRGFFHLYRAYKYELRRAWSILSYKRIG